MSAADDKGINLLPADLQKKREQVKRAITSTSFEYTDPKKTAASEKKKKSFFSFFKRKKKPITVQQPKKEHTTQPADLPTGKPLPSALFATQSNNKETQQPSVSKKEIPQKKQEKSTQANSTIDHTTIEALKTVEKKKPSVTQTPEKHVSSSVIQPTHYTDTVPHTKGVSARSVQNLHQPNFAHVASLHTLEKELEQKVGPSKKKNIFSRILSTLFFKKSAVDTPKKDELKERPVETPSIKNNISEKSITESKENTHQKIHNDSSDKQGWWKKFFGRKHAKQLKTKAIATKTAQQRQQPNTPVVPKKVLPVANQKTKEAPSPKPSSQSTQQPLAPSKTQTSQESVKQLAAPVAQTKKTIAPVTPTAKNTQVPSAPQVTAQKISDEKVQATAEGLTEAPIHRKTLFDVNLLSGEFADSFVEKNPLQTIGLGAAVSVLFVLFVYTGLALYQSQGAGSVQYTEQVNTALMQAINTYKTLEDEDQLLRQKVSIIDALLSEHISWNTFLGKLEAVTIPEVTYTSFSASVDGTILIGALSTNYTSLARQMAVFQQETPWIDTVTITSAALAQDNTGQSDGVRFDIALTVDKEALLAISFE